MDKNFQNEEEVDSNIKLRRAGRKRGQSSFQAPDIARSRYDPFNRQTFKRKILSSARQSMIWQHIHAVMAVFEDAGGFLRWLCTLGDEGGKGSESRTLIVGAWPQWPISSVQNEIKNGVMMVE